MKQTKKAVIAFVAAALLFASLAWSQTPMHQWSQRFGEFREDSGRDIAVDADGNLFVTGWVRGPVDFGGGILAAGGGTDLYVAKYDPAGAHLWSRRAGDGSDQVGFTIASDPLGGVVVAGYMFGTADFGGGVLTSAGSGDVLVVKYDASGNHVWSQRFGSTLFDSGLGVAVDAAGNILIAGSFAGTVDFGGGDLVSAGSFDVFVAKYNGAGAHVWSERFGSDGVDQAWGVTIGNPGSIFVTGNFNDTVDFGGGGLASAGGNDIFLARYDTNGTHVWSQRFGSNGSDVGLGVSVRGPGNIFVTGSFENTVDFGGGGLVSVGGNDIFLAAYDSSGAHQWSRRFGGTESDLGFDVAAGAECVLLTGVFRGTADFGGGPFVSAGASDIFGAGYDASGNHIWSQRFGDTGWDEGLGIDLDSTGNVFMSGQFEGTVDFGGGGLTSADDADIFIAKFGDATTAVAIASFTAKATREGVELRGTFSSDLAIVGVRIYRSESPENRPELYASVPHAGGELSYEDRGVEPGRTYWYQIGVVDGDGEFLSQIVAVTTPGYETALLQNWPNPFNPSTIIQFELGETQRVVIRIYDVRGKLIRTLIDDVWSPGLHAIEWDGTDDGGTSVSSGVYFYRMMAGGVSQSRRMVLLK